MTARKKHDHRDRLDNLVAQAREEKRREGIRRAGEFIAQLFDKQPGGKTATTKMEKKDYERNI